MKGATIIEVYGFRRHDNRRQGQEQQGQETVQHL
jgi:hypothetical protein